MSKNVMRKIKIVLISLVLGAATACSVSALKRLPYSRARDVVTDALSSPGGILATMLYPEGVHTGTGAPTWGIIAFAGNLLCYAVLWFLLLTLIAKLRTVNSSRIGGAAAL